MKHRFTEILAALALASAIALTVYELFVHNDNAFLFEWVQLWHYESFIACALVASVALIVGKYLGKRGY